MILFDLMDLNQIENNGLSCKEWIENHFHYRNIVLTIVCRWTSSVKATFYESWEKYITSEKLYSLFYCTLSSQNESEEIRYICNKTSAFESSKQTNNYSLCCLIFIQTEYFVKDTSKTLSERKRETEREEKRVLCWFEINVWFMFGGFINVCTCCANILEYPMSAYFVKAELCGDSKSFSAHLTYQGAFYINNDTF